MLPQNGHRPGADLPAQSMAYQVLVQSIKQELASALEKVAEKSAKRILVEFHKGSGVKANLSRNDDLGTTPNDHRSQFTPKRSADNGAIAMTTQNKISNPSVMLYASKITLRMIEITFFIKVLQNAVIVFLTAKNQRHNITESRRTFRCKFQDHYQ